MIAFHGSKSRFSEFAAPETTGIVASGASERRRGTGFGYVYVTDDIDAARDYATRVDGVGYIYAVNVPDDSRTLAAHRAACGLGAKAREFQDDTRVVPPGHVAITGVFRVEKRRGAAPIVTPV